MARPVKIGLDYFSLDVNLDDNVELMEADCGLQGFAIMIKLWQKIYAEGYFIEWKEDNALLFSRKINTEITLVNSVVIVCLSRGIFSNELYEKFKILTSKGIQKRYLTVCKQLKRTAVPFIEDYMLVNPELTEVISEFIPKNSGESTQKKGKEKKGEEMKGKDNKEKETVVVVIDKENDIFTDYAKAGFGIASSTQADQLIELEDTYGYEWTRDAIKEAALNNILRITYVEGILKNWKAKGRNAQKPQYKNGKEVKKDFTERNYNYKQEEEKLLGWGNVPEAKSDGEDILQKIIGGK